MRSNGNLQRRIKLLSYVIAALCFLVAVAYLIFCLGIFDGIGPQSLLRAEPLDSEADFIRFIDIGQGDSILLCSNGQSALLDVGPAEAADRLNAELNSLGIKELSAVMISHGHLDHIGGLPELLEHHPVKTLIHPSLGDAEEGRSILHAAQVKVAEERGTVNTFCEKMKITVGEFRITVLMYRNDADSENDRSVVLTVEKGGLRFLMMGDAGESTEKQLLEDYPDLTCNALKVGHHGSRTSACEDFLKTCKPCCAVISCGEGNEYNHPHDETLTRLEEARIGILRTDLDGSITFDVTDDSLECKTERSNKSITLME